MSYDLEFNCGPLVEPHYIRGGTYALGGSNEPCINITYNYASFFWEHLGEGGIRSLYGMTAAQVVARLDEVLPSMKGAPNDDYWQPCEGNAKAALQKLRELAAMCPVDAILEGD